MRLSGNRAKAHSAGAEALDDLTGRLDFVKRNRATCSPRLELEQAAERAALTGLGVYGFREFLVRIRITAACGHLQGENRFRVPGMTFASAAPVELAGIRQFRQLVVDARRVP